VTYLWHFTLGARLAMKTALVATHDRELAERVATRIVAVRDGMVE
jgi:ABC-type ATPase involved in cell division